ncbi:right-handed parallel beta-helix repeat-containing protein [Halomarina halobia]|nr:right-handed parallel beta-helix repeat-containing protein [Halomarina sp. PSR21]
MGAATTASLSLLGVAGTASAEGAKRHGITFDRVVNAVDDLGMDPNGNRPIDDALENAAESGTLIEFPPGEYRATREHAYFQLEDFGIRGTGDSRRDTQFVFPEGYNDRFLVLRWGRNHLVENVTLQQYEDGETSVGCVFAPTDGLQVHDFEIAGYNARSGQRGLAVYIYDEDGTGVIDGYVRRGGGAVGDYPSGTQAMFVGKSHRGTLYVRNAHIEESGENGIYASRTNGDVRIENSFFKNNDIASVRIAGEGSYVKGSTFVVDTDSAENDPEAFDNVRGLWWESGGYEKVGGYAEDCDFVLESADVSGGLLRVAPTAGAMTVRNCRFRNETTHPSLLARAPNDMNSTEITVDGVSITGRSDDPRRGGIEIVERSGSTVTDSCINRQGGNGVVVRRASGCTVKDSTIDVPGEPVVEDDAGVATSNIDESGSCPLPDANGSGGSSGGSSGDSGSDGDSDSDAEADSDSAESSSGSDTDEGGEAGEGGEPTGDGDGSGGADGSDDSSNESGDSSGGSARSTDGNATDGNATDGNATSGNSTSGGTEGGNETGGNETDGGSADSGSSGDGSGDDGSSDGGSLETATADGDGERSKSSKGGSSSDDDGGDDGDDGSGSATRSTGATPQSLPNVLSLRSKAVSPYRIVVDGAIELDPEFGVEDVVSGNTAQGVLARGWDVYRYSGEIVTFDIDGPAEISHNGTFVDPDELGIDGSDESGSDEELPNTISIKGDAGDLLPYHIEVSGDIEFDPDYGTEDRIADGTAEGVIATGGWDVYRYSGEIVTFDVVGDADVEVNGESVDEASI